MECRGSAETVQMKAGRQAGAEEPVVRNNQGQTEACLAGPKRLPAAIQSHHVQVLLTWRNGSVTCLGVSTSQ